MTSDEKIIKNDGKESKSDKKPTTKPAKSDDSSSDDEDEDLIRESGKQL